MKEIIVVFLALFMMMSSSVYGQTMTYGHGTQTCGDYVKALEGYGKGADFDIEDYFIFMSWFKGYASGISSGSGENVLHGKDTDSFALSLEKYCRANPLDKFVAASKKVLNDLKK